MDSKELEGKVSLVTGASRGLGQAIAIKLASMGARVAVNYSTNDERAKGVIETIERNGGEAMLIKADVSNSNAVKAMIKEIVAKWEKIDILVNNAGIVRDNLILRMPDTAWDEVINTNLRSAYLCSKYALRSMMDQPWGRIINISSLAGVVGNPGQSNYSASKGGLIAFTKSLARETGPRNITVNAIAPGFIVSEMTDSLPQEIKDSILARIPLSRFGVPEDIAELAGFLASERSSYITAQVIGIDGGVI
jgi:3-oxoacyl-[acyl-carrier protein] reductase